MIALLMLAAVWGPGTENYDGWPPVRYSHEGAALVAFASQAHINQLCDDPDPTLEACQDGGLIVLPNPCTFPKTDDFARLACHELAHQNGWAGNHPR